MTTADLKPFPVVSGKYLFWFTPADEGGFTVVCQNLTGVNAQGDTFESALENAAGMAAFVEECRAELAREEAQSPPRRIRRARKSQVGDPV